MVASTRRSVGDAALSILLIWTSVLDSKAFSQVLDHLASSDFTILLYRSVFEKFVEYRRLGDNNYDSSIPHIRDILVNAPKFKPLSMDRTNDLYSSYWGMVSTAGRAVPEIQINGNLIHAFEEVPEDSPLFTILAFIVAVTILEELCEYTIKLIVGPRIRPYWRLLHEWSGRTWEDIVFDRGHVSVMWLKENVGIMNNILGVALQQKKGRGLQVPREDYQKELSMDVCSSFLASIQSTSLEPIKFHDLPDSQRGPEITFTRLTPLPIGYRCLYPDTVMVPVGNHHGDLEI